MSRHTPGPRAHTHEYEPHPSLSTHHYCTVCGFAAPSAVLQPLHLKKATGAPVTKPRPDVRSEGPCAICGSRTRFDICDTCWANGGAK